VGARVWRAVPDAEAPDHDPSVEGSAPSAS